MARDMTELKKKGKGLEPIVRIGKNGMTESVITQIKKALEKRELVKIKFLRSFTESVDRKESAKQIAKEAKATLVEQVGLVAVYFKPAYREPKDKTPRSEDKNRLKKRKGPRRPKIKNKNFGQSHKKGTAKKDSHKKGGKVTTNYSNRKGASSRSRNVTKRSIRRQ